MTHADARDPTDAHVTRRSARASPAPRPASLRTLAFVVLLAATCATPPVRASETVAPPVLPDPGAWLPRKDADLRLLDKVGAQATPLLLVVGQSSVFHSLSITLRACVTRPPELPPDSAAFLDIVDSHEGQPGFHGWMFSGEPQVAMLENPLYDIHLLSCRADAPPPPATPPARAPR